MTVGVVEVGGVSQPGADAELYSVRVGWLGVVTGINAASTGCFLVYFLKRSDMATQFYLQTSHTCFYSPAAEHHHPLVGTHFTVPRRAEG